MDWPSKAARNLACKACSVLVPHIENAVAQLPYFSRLEAQIADQRKELAELREEFMALSGTTCVAQEADGNGCPQSGIVQLRLRRSLSLPTLGDSDTSLVRQPSITISEDYLAEQRKENIEWRQWAKNMLLEAQTQQEAPPLRRKRHVFIGILLGVVISGLFLKLEVINPPPVPQMLDEASQHLQLLLNSTLGAASSTAEEPDPTLPALALSSSLLPKHPLLLLPGLVSTGLEVWQADECLGGRNAYFRKRLWGTTTMLQAVMRNMSCWLQHLRLDPVTGLDPPNIKLRAARGFEAADYLIAGYWVWAKLLENLAVMGYDSNTMALLSYDWRLSFPKLEQRDHFFSRMQVTVEQLVEVMGEKVVVVAHSLGANVWMYFMQWINKAGRAPGWVEKYVHGVVSLGGPLLGAFGPLTALLSGEMHMGSMGGILESMAPGAAGRMQRRSVFQTWGSMQELLPAGGDAVWGNESEPTDCRCDVVSRADGSSLSVDSALEFLRNITTQEHEAHDTCGNNSRVCEESDELESAITSNPLDAPLPKAPNLRMFCLYGVGARTERAYLYSAVTPDDPAGSIDYARRKKISNSYSLGPLEDTQFEYGLATVDGDGTVPLLSLGYMCMDGWRSLKALNPGGVQTFVREYIDESTSVFVDPRGGPKTSKHVEILGNQEVIVDILHIAAGQDEALRSDRVHSRIEEISKRVTKRVLQSQPKLGLVGVGWDWTPVRHITERFAKGF